MLWRCHRLNDHTLRGEVRRHTVGMVELEELKAAAPLAIELRDSVVTLLLCAPEVLWRCHRLNDHTLRGEVRHHTVGMVELEELKAAAPLAIELRDSVVVMRDLTEKPVVAKHRLGQRRAIGHGSRGGALPTQRKHIGMPPVEEIRWLEIVVTALGYRQLSVERRGDFGRLAKILSTTSR